MNQIFLDVYDDVVDLADLCKLLISAIEMTLKVSTTFLTQRFSQHTAHHIRSDVNHVRYYFILKLAN